MTLENVAGDPRPTSQWVLANLVVGSDGSTTARGRSRGLSSSNDRERFHVIRKSADALVIGGNTARNEPYATTPIPLFVLSRHTMLPPKVALNGQATLLHLDLTSAINRIFAQGYSKILIEGGAQLFMAALKSKILNGFYLTRTNTATGENCLDLVEMDRLIHEENFIELERENEEGEIFSFFARAEIG